MEIEILPDKLITEIKKYTDTKVKRVNEAVKKYTEEALEKITNDSPVRKAPASGVRKTRSGAVKADNLQSGSYKKGWIPVVKKYETRTQGYVRNKNNPQLTHLLEQGHENKKNGSWVKGIPHIIDNQNETREELNEEIKKIMEE